MIDSTLTKGDSLKGQVLGQVGSLPPVHDEINIEFFLLRELLGVKSIKDANRRIKKIADGDVLRVNMGPIEVLARVESCSEKKCKIRSYSTKKSTRRPFCF